MAGIVTTSTSGSIRTYRAVFTATTTSLAINFVTGTTSGIPGVVDPTDKGVGVIFQNASPAGVNVTIGGSNVTVNAIGILLAPFAATSPGTYQWQPRHAPSAIMMSDYWVSTTSSLAVVVGQLLKAV